MRDDNPNKTFKGITILFAIIVIVSFIGYLGYNNQDGIKSWWNNLWVDDEPEEESSPQQMGNLSDDLSAINQINQIFSFMPILIGIIIIGAIIVPLFRVFSNPMGDYKEIHSIKKA